MQYLLRYKKIIFGLVVFISICAVHTVYTSVPVFADEITTVPDGGIDKGGNNIFTNIRDTVNTLFATIKGASNAVIQTYTQIKSFRDIIKDMISTMSSGSSGANTGVPVTEAIGTIRYCIGDNLFYAIYLSIIFGLLFTLTKLVKVVYKQILKLGEMFNSIGGKTAILNKIKNLFSGF